MTSTKSSSFDAVTIWQYEKGSVFAWLIVPPIVFLYISYKEGIIELLPIFGAWGLGLAIIIKGPFQLLKLSKREREHNPRLRS